MSIVVADDKSNAMSEELLDLENYFDFDPVRKPAKRSSSGSDELELCRVCDERAEGRHFGAITCRACAAFFRRSIARKLKFTCQLEGNCAVRKDPGHLICRECRMKKCRAVGMLPEALQPPRGPATHRTRKRSVSSMSPSTTSASAPTSPEAVETRVFRYDTAGNEPANAVSTPQPTPYPMLCDLIYGYDRLQQNRDVSFNRIAPINNVPTRHYFESNCIDGASHQHDVQTDFGHVLEYLHIFPTFQSLPHTERELLLPRFFEQFAVLERCFDTYSIIGELNDNRFLMPNGNIIDGSNVCLNRSEADTSIEQQQGEQKPSPISWIQQSVHKLLPLVKTLRPVPAEMTYCYAMLLYNTTPSSINLLMPETRCVFQATLETITNELNTYYAKELPFVNIVDRASSLMRIVMTAERIAESYN